MFVNAIPPGALEILLFAALFGAFLFVVLRVARRNAFLPDLTGIDDVARLVTSSRQNVQLRRIYRYDDVALGEGTLSNERLKFCIADFTAGVDAYRSALKSPITIAPYALARLDSIDANGYLDAYVRSDNIDAVKLSLTHSGPRPNDYTLRGTVAAIRKDEVDGQNVFVYRFMRDDGFTLEAAVSAPPEAAPFTEGEDVIGTARLYAYLPTD